MSRTRRVEVYSAITKLDSFAPHFVQLRTLALSPSHRLQVLAWEPLAHIANNSIVARDFIGSLTEWFLPTSPEPFSASMPKWRISLS
jgi:hypothetical protein